MEIPTKDEFANEAYRLADSGIIIRRKVMRNNDADIYFSGFMECEKWLRKLKYENNIPITKEPSFDITELVEIAQKLPKSTMAEKILKFVKDTNEFIKEAKNKPTCSKCGHILWTGVHGEKYCQNCRE